MLQRRQHCLLVGYSQKAVQVHIRAGVEGRNQLRVSGKTNYSKVLTHITSGVLEKLFLLMRILKSIFLDSMIHLLI